MKKIKILKYWVEEKSIKIVMTWNRNKRPKYKVESEIIENAPNVRECEGCPFHPTSGPCLNVFCLDIRGLLYFENLEAIRKQHFWILPKTKEKI